MPQILFRPQAWRDIFESAEYLEEQSGFELADRFIDAVRETAQILENMPLMVCALPIQPARTTQFPNSAGHRF
jgi:plasmid stabilization system protein ParE